MGLGEFLSGVGSVIETGIETLPAIIQAGQQPTVNLPALGLQPGAFPQLPTGAAGLPMATAGGCAQFVQTQSRMRAVREIRAVNPSTNKIESWTHRGSPIIWSGDRAIARKYAKQAGFTLRRRRGGGSSPAARRRVTRRRS